MTQEEKQLLLKDISARLPYKVKLGFENSDLILVPEEFNIYTKQLSANQIYPKVNRAVIKHIYDVWNYRPYLRPMSSMTEDEKEEYRNECNKVLSMPFKINGPYPIVDWLNSHHFDHRGLIEKRLALEAPKGMYKTE